VRSRLESTSGVVTRSLFDRIREYLDELRRRVVRPGTTANPRTSTTNSSRSNDEQQEQRRTRGAQAQTGAQQEGEGTNTIARHGRRSRATAAAPATEFPIVVTVHQDAIQIDDVDELQHNFDRRNVSRPRPSAADDAAIDRVVQRVGRLSELSEAQVRAVASIALVAMSVDDSDRQRRDNVAREDRRRLHRLGRD
jgi:hypothetical protein